MSHRDTQVAWDIESQEIVYIGDKEDWEMTGRDDVGPEGRPIWIPKAGKPEKAERGRKHYCCSHKCLPLRVNQGAVNEWSFSSVRSGLSLSSCNLQSMLGKFRNARGEGPRHKKAKYILAHFLQSPPGKAEFNVKEVLVEKEIPGESVIPDITIEHDDGQPDTYVEIVVTSAPHQNPNAWLFYESRQEQLVVIDVKDNERGWHYQKERIHEILEEKFRRYFNDPDRTNAPKIWDERVSSMNPISGLVRKWVDSHLDVVARKAWEQEQQRVKQQDKANKEEELKLRNKAIAKANKKHEKLKRKMQSKKARRKAILERDLAVRQQYYRTKPKNAETIELIKSKNLETIRIESFRNFRYDFTSSFGRWLNCDIEDKELIDQAREYYRSGGPSIAASIRGNITSTKIILDHDLIEDLVSAAEDEVKLLTEAYDEWERGKDARAKQDAKAAERAEAKAYKEHKAAVVKRNKERTSLGPKATEVTNQYQAISNAASTYNSFTVHVDQDYQALTRIQGTHDKAIGDIRLAMRNSPQPHYGTVKKEVEGLLEKIGQVPSAVGPSKDYINSKRTELEAFAEPLSMAEEAATEHCLPLDYWARDYPDRESDLETRLAGLSEHTDTIAEMKTFLADWKTGYTDATQWEEWDDGYDDIHGELLLAEISLHADDAIRLCDGRIVGTLKFFDSTKGFGFIKPDDTQLKDHWFHESYIVHDKSEISKRQTRWSTPKKVIFESSIGPKSPVAKRVQLKSWNW